MAKKNKIFMPSTGGGIVRYEEDKQLGIKMKPEHVIAIIVAVIIGEIVLHTL